MVAFSTFPSTFTPHTQCKFSPTVATDIQSVQSMSRKRADRNVAYLYISRKRLRFIIESARFFLFRTPAASSPSARTINRTQSISVIRIKHGEGSQMQADLSAKFLLTLPDVTHNRNASTNFCNNSKYEVLRKSVGLDSLCSIRADGGTKVTRPVITTDNYFTKAPHHCLIIGMKVKLGVLLRMNFLRTRIL